MIKLKRCINSAQRTSMHLTKHLFRRGALSWIILFTGRFSAVLVQAIVFLLASRVVGVSEYGGFVYAFGIAQIFATASMAGGSQLLLRALPAAEANERLQNTFPCILSVSVRSLAIILGVIILSCIIPEGYIAKYSNLSFVQLVSTLGLGAVIAGLNLSSAINRQANSANVVVFVKDLLPFVAFGFLIVGCELLGQPLAGNVLVLLCLASFAIALVVSMYLNARFTKMSFVLWQSQPVPLAATRYRKGYGYFWASSIAATLSANLDVVLGRILLGTETIGIYSIIKRASSVVGISQSVANLSVSRAIVLQYESKQLAILQRTLARAFYLASVPALIVAIALYLSSNVWMSFFDLPSTHATHITLVLVLASASFNVFCGTNILLAAQTGEEKLVFMTRLTSMFSVIIFLPILAIAFQSAGLATAVLFQSVLMNTVILVVMYKRTGLWTSLPLSAIIKYK